MERADGALAPQKLAWRRGHCIYGVRGVSGNVCFVFKKYKKFQSRENLRLKSKTKNKRFSLSLTTNLATLNLYLFVYMVCVYSAGMVCLYSVLFPHKRVYACMCCFDMWVCVCVCMEYKVNSFFINNIKIPFLVKMS